MLIVLNGELAYNTIVIEFCTPHSKIDKLSKLKIRGRKMELVLHFRKSSLEKKVYSNKHVKKREKDLK